MTTPKADPVSAEDKVGRLLRMQPVLLYGALAAAGLIAARIAHDHLAAQRQHLLEHEDNLMAWSAFVVESPLTTLIEPLVVDTRISRAPSFDPRDVSASEAKQKLEAWASTRIKTTPMLIESILVIDNEGRALTGDSPEITPDMKAIYDELCSAAMQDTFFAWRITPAPDNPDAPDGERSRLRLWVPRHLQRTPRPHGAVVYTLKLKALGSQEKIASLRRTNVRVVSQTMRQAASRGLTEQAAHSRTLILDTNFRVIQSRTGDSLSGSIPDPGARVDLPEIRRAYEKGVREKLRQVSFSTPATADMPACHALLDLSPLGRGYMILAQADESALLQPWYEARRMALYAGGLMAGAFALVVLFDLRRRRNRAELAELANRLSLQLAREQEMRHAQALLESRVEARTAELAEANRELDAYARTVSHDLRAPLRAVKNRVDMLEEEEPALAAGRSGEHFRRIRANVHHMSRLIEDILRLSKLSRRTPERQRCDLAELARDIAERLREAWPDRPVRLTLPDRCEAFADPALMRIALENLLGNAWKYCSKTPDARVEFGVRTAAGGRTEYFVRDNGAGFPNELTDRLFKPFSRLHPSSEFEGTGLGLATAARIIRLHGGVIRAEGAKGAGACFSFSLADA